MKKKNYILSITLSLIFLFGMYACSSRVNTPEVLTDSTIYYPGNSIDDISAQITLCRTISSKSGKIIGEGTAFTIMDSEKVKAIINLENLKYDANDSLMFHVYWIGPDDKSIYRKCIYEKDSVSSISSTISIDPEKRAAGDYKVRFYYFRELVAEKAFKLFQPIDSLRIENIEDFPELLLRSDFMDNNLPSKIDSVFSIKKGNSVSAYFDFGRREFFGNRELRFTVKWNDSKGETFLKKRINLNQYDTAKFIQTSISLDPAKRDTGRYSVEMYLFDRLIAIKSFILRKEEVKKELSPFKASITFYKKKDKTSGKLIGVGDNFQCGEKQKVRASIVITWAKNKIAKELNVKLQWCGPDGKPFYTKESKNSTLFHLISLNSAISIPANKRKPGKYILKVYVDGFLISKRIFNLQ